MRKLDDYKKKNSRNKLTVMAAVNVSNSNSQIIHEYFLDGIV